MNENPEPSKAWLDRLDHACRSWAGNLFLAAIGNAATTTPREVCRTVALRLKAGAGRTAGLDDPQVRAIFDAMIGDPEGAMAYAADRLAHLRLSAAERKAKREEAAKQHREEWIRRNGGRP